MPKGIYERPINKHKVINEESVEISLTQGYSTIIDTGDLELVLKYKWQVLINKKTGEVRATSDTCNRKTGCRYLQHLLLPQKEGFIVDHIDRNPLNNKRDNLRYATRGENNQNITPRKNKTSSYLGVKWHKQHQKWYSQINFEKKRYFLGLFRDEVEAAEAYNKAVEKYYGQHGNRNQF